jgi:hypothetical protein
MRWNAMLCGNVLVLSGETGPPIEGLPWFRQLVTGLSPWGPGLIPGQSIWDFVAYKVAPGQVFL